VSRGLSESILAGATEASGARPAPAWFCVRSQPKHEHIAAVHLAKDPTLEVYLPRIRFKRATRRGPVWFTEALFPNYLFVRFELALSLRKVCHARGVRGIVHFGSRWPVVPDPVIDEMRLALGNDEVHVIPEELEQGEAVRIAGGAFHGLRAIVTRVIPSRERVAVLLDFLGRQTAVELPREALIREMDERKLVI
jgi:transcriptional antiterminator RfaH